NDSLEILLLCLRSKAGGRVAEARGPSPPHRGWRPGCWHPTEHPPSTFHLQIEALQEVLEKLKSERLASIEKKLGLVPSCDAGEPCAVRKGARIGRLCNCPRGTACNFYILKCL
uniref:Cocaine- and amphetamine-regulated transcript protein n=1 Tax=Pelusios castaneus TaxID=367368 RepID=A0A8C8SEK0_9SAUR